MVSTVRTYTLASRHLTGIEPVAFPAGKKKKEKGHSVMKKVISSMLILLLALGLLTTAAPKAYAASSVTINSTNFPDANFRAYVKNNLDTNGDGNLSAAEQSVYYISVSNMGITNLKGIEHFTWLEELNCSHNKLTSLDISKNTELRNLYCQKNTIPGVDISNNPYLLECADDYSSYDESYSPEEETILLTGWSLDGYSRYYLQYDKNTAIYRSTITSKPSITKQPSNQTVSVGNKATFTVKASGVTKYQWQYRTSATGSWTSVSSIDGKKANYSLTAAARHDGYQYRCKVTNPAGSVYTSVRTLSLNAYAKPAITEQPAGQTVLGGAKATFSVTATGGGLSYQWQYRTSSSGSWAAVSASSGKTATYSLTAKAKHNGYQYRCKVTNSKGTVYTSSRTLSVVTEKPAITTQPINKTVTTGKTAKFTVKASGQALSYQWYYRTSSTGAWTAVAAESGKTASYSLTAKAKHNGYQYRCKVTNLLGTVYTNTVTLKVNN